MSVLFVKYEVNLIYGIKYIESVECTMGVVRLQPTLQCQWGFSSWLRILRSCCHQELNLDQWQCNLEGESDFLVKVIVSDTFSGFFNWNNLDP